MKKENESGRIGKKGSVTVFAMMLSSAVLSMIVVFIMYSETALVKTGTSYLGDLWGKSILAEYDRELYERYGILSYLGDEGVVENKLNFYKDYTFSDKNYASVNVEDISLYPYALSDTENFLVQIRKNCILEKIAELGEGGRVQGMRYDAEDKASEDPRCLSNQSTIAGLPSYGRVSNDLLSRAEELVKILVSVKDIVKKGTDSYLINRYIDSKFRNIYSSQGSGDSFFYGEQEYIVSGLFSDEANRKSVRNRIIAMREAMNLIYIERNPEMSDAIRLAGAALTLGVAEEEAAQAIMAAWALAESVNDYLLLIKGKHVPLMKDKDTWATDLESVLNNDEKGCIYTGHDRGDNYNDYVMYLLFLVDEETRLLRILDLIQINMIYTYNSDFRIRDCYVGVGFTLNGNGEKNEVISIYDK